MKTIYELNSVKAVKFIQCTCAEARREARKMRDNLQPTGGVAILLDGITICTAK